jgi:peptide deformylase
MAILTVLTEPDPRLRIRSAPVTNINAALHTHIQNMQDTLVHEEGFAIAAPQVGITKRVVMFDMFGLEPEETHDKRFLCMINPEIVWRSGTSCGVEEGCLSIPALRIYIDRDAHIRVSFLTPEGTQETLEARDIFAICIQHEIDHLDGILMIDYLSPLRKDMAQRKLAKIKKELNG